MIEQVRKVSLKRTKVEEIQIVYHLVFKNALYSLECFIEGSEDKYNYCYIEDITDDEGEAEAFLILMVKGKVLPFHVREIAEDYFGK